MLNSTFSEPTLQFCRVNQREVESFPCLPAGVSVVSVGVAHGLGPGGGPEVERTGPRYIPRAVAEAILASVWMGHVLEKRV